MNDNEDILIIWESFEPDFTGAKRKEKAYDYLRAVQDTSLNCDHDLLKGHSPSLDDAIEQIAQEDGIDEDEEGIGYED